MTLGRSLQVVEVSRRVLADVTIAIKREWNKPGVELTDNAIIICVLVCGCCLHYGARFGTANAVTGVGLDNGDIIPDLIGLVYIFHVDYILMDDRAIRSDVTGTSLLRWLTGTGPLPGLQKTGSNKEHGYWRCGI